MRRPRLVHALLAGFALFPAVVEPALHAQETPPSTQVDFRSADGLRVTADYYEGSRADDPVILLFHQSGASRGEFRTIAPRLREMGFHALAVDLRWGGMDRWHRVVNETAARNRTQALVEAIEAGEASPWPTIFQSYQDMEAALAWADGMGLTGPRLVLGSSFSSILVFRLAAEHPEVDGVLSFSPAEYFEEDTTLVRRWAAGDTVPTFIGAAVDEDARAWPILQAVKSRRKEMVLGPLGTHGASVLGQDDGMWRALVSFLRRTLPRRPAGPLAGRPRGGSAFEADPPEPNHMANNVVR